VKIGKTKAKRLASKKKVKKAPIFANTTSSLLMGEATVKTVLSSPSSFGFRTKSEIPVFMSIAPIIVIAQKNKNMLQMVLKIGGLALLL